MCDALFGGDDSDDEAAAVTIPTVEATPVVVEAKAQTPETQAVKSDAKKKALAAGGLSGTNATSALGVSGTANTTKKSLLGQ